jgi:hypothetical protein
MKYATYDDVSGKISSLTTTSFGAPIPISGESLLEIDEAISMQENKINVITLEIEPADPVIVENYELVGRANRRIENASAKINTYRTLPSLVVDQIEFEDYVIAVNVAIATQPREFLVLPDRPLWFI